MYIDGKLKVENIYMSLKLINIDSFAGHIYIQFNSFLIQNK